MKTSERWMEAATIWQVVNCVLIAGVFGYVLWEGELAILGRPAPLLFARTAGAAVAASTGVNNLVLVACWLTMERHLRTTTSAFSQPYRHCALAAAAWGVFAAGPMWWLVWLYQWDDYRGPPIVGAWLLSSVVGALLLRKAGKMQEGAAPALADAMTWVVRSPARRPSQRPGMGRIDAATPEGGRPFERSLLLLFALAMLSAPVLTQIALRSGETP